MTAVESDQRRSARHAATREEIIAHAVDIMGTQGVVGLTLGELGRRIGVRTPSLYTYFNSKNAVYDELFRRGWQETLDHHRALVERLGPVGLDTDLVARALEVTTANIRWHLSRPAYAQLMLFRPIPDWEPTPDAYAPAVAFAELAFEEFTSWREAGLVRADTDIFELNECIVNATTGLISRQLSNDPGTPYDQGRHTPHWPALITAVVRSYLP